MVTHSLPTLPRARSAEAARDQARKEASELSASLERARAESTQLASRLRGAEVDRAETERKLHILQERLKLAEQSEQRLQDQALALEQTIENERASRVAIERARAASAADVKALRARERELTERVDAMELEKSVTMRQLQELKNKAREEGCGWGARGQRISKRSELRPGLCLP